MLTAPTRRPITLFLAALITVLAAVGAGVTLAPAAHAAGVQNRVRAFTPAAQPLVRSASTGSPCSRPGSTVSAARIAVGFCVAAKEGAAALPRIAGGSQEFDLINSGGNLVDKGGMTQAGRSIESHAGQGAFPSVSGGAAEKNALGQQQLEEIVGNPASMQEPVSSGNFPGGTRYIAPDGRGATFDPSGQFRYFGRYPPF